MYQVSNPISQSQKGFQAKVTTMKNHLITLQSNTLNQSAHSPPGVVFNLFSFPSPTAVQSLSLFSYNPYCIHAGMPELFLQPLTRSCHAGKPKNTWNRKEHDLVPS
jgi:hypothetical protein